MTADRHDRRTTPDRARYFFLISLGLSLVCHGALVWIGATWLSKVSSTAVVVSSAQSSAPVIVPTQELPPPVIRWGEGDSTGTAQASLNDVTELRAPQAPVDSPLLRKDARRSTAQEQLEANRAERESTEAKQQKQLLQQRAPTIRDALSQRQFKRPEESEEAKQEAQKALAQQSAETQKEADAQQAAEAAQAAPNSASDAKEDAEVADTETDAFSTKEGFDFQRGGAKARPGRMVKFKRPEVDLAFRADVTQLGLPIGTVLRVRIDKTGSPRQVEVVRSSNSTIIDQYITVAAYASWFEPKEPYEFDFGVTFR